MKTCKKCGSVEKYARGQCKPCKIAYNTEYHADKVRNLGPNLPIREHVDGAVKWCSQCATEKPTCDFYWHIHMKDGLMHCCKPCQSKTDANYREKHKVRQLDQKRKNYAANSDLYKQRVSAHQKLNAAACNARNAAHAAQKKGATPLWADRDAIKIIYAAAQNAKMVTGVPHEVDHIVPINSKIVCGLHCESNLRVITEVENCRKGNRHWPDMP